jgi:hypothetical protein
VTPDDLQQRQMGSIITHDPMGMPTIVTPPAINDQWFAGLEFYKQCIMDDIGVHEVSKAESDTTTSGIMVELLQEQDTTQIREAHDNIERGEKWRGEWEIALVSQFYAEPRMVAMSQSADPQTAAMNARSFEALTNGGQCTVQVQPGSSIAKSPAARQAWIMDMMKSGGFTPQMMPLLIISSKLLGLEQSDITSEQLSWAAQQMQQYEQTLQQGQAQAQMQAQQQAAQQDLQTKLALLQATAEIEFKQKMALAQLENQANLQMEQNKTNADVLINRDKLQGQIVLEHHKSIDQMFADMRQAIGTMTINEHLKSMPNVSLGATVKLGSVAGPDAEEKWYGLKPDPAAEIATTNKPAPVGFGAGGVGGK